MIGTKVIFKAPKTGWLSEGAYEGIIKDKIIMGQPIFVHKPTVMHSSCNPEYSETIQVNGYLIEETETKKLYSIYPEKVVKIVN